MVRLLDVSNIIPSLRYTWLTLKHKYFVYKVGRVLKVNLWRRLTHDLSKLGFKELPHYGRQFFGAKDRPYRFIKCWVHHQNSNDHHWEYWIPRTGHDRCDPPYKANEPIPMSNQAIREMIADWIGASRAYEGKWPIAEQWWWYYNRFQDIVVHDDTRRKIMYILQEELKIV
jgi:hypothetical protein